MVEIPVVFAILIGIALVIVIWVEANEYRKFLKAAKAVSALAAGMQITFEQMGEHMNRFSSIQTALVLDSEEKDRQIQSMLLVQSAQTEVLSLKLLTEIAKAVTENVREDEDATRAV